MQSRQTCHTAVSPKITPLLLFALLLPLPYLVVLHSALSLNMFMSLCHTCELDRAITKTNEKLENYTKPEFWLPV